MLLIGVMYLNDFRRTRAWRVRGWQSWNSCRALSSAKTTQFRFCFIGSEILLFGSLIILMTIYWIEYLSTCYRLSAPIDQIAYLALASKICGRYWVRVIKRELWSWSYKWKSINRELSSESYQPKDMKWELLTESYKEIISVAEGIAWHHCVIIINQIMYTDVRLTRSTVKFSRVGNFRNNSSL